MTRTTEKYRIRNYRAMTDEKLLRVKDELERGIDLEEQGVDVRGRSGFYDCEAFIRCLQRGSGAPVHDLSICQEIAAERGLA